MPSRAVLPIHPVTGPINAIICRYTLTPLFVLPSLLLVDIETISPSLNLTWQRPFCHADGQVTAIHQVMMSCSRMDHRLVLVIALLEARPNHHTGCITHKARPSVLALNLRASFMNTSSSVAFATPQSSTVICCFTLCMASNTPLRDTSLVGSSYLSVPPRA